MQLQYEDHLRKQKLLRYKIERIAHAKIKLENCVETKSISEENNKQGSSEVLQQESNDSSFDLSLLSSQEIIVSADSHNQEAIVCEPSVEDLQMQVLSLTQALEDSNRENTHLRNIVIRFKEALHEKFGLTQDEIEAMLVNSETEQAQSVEQTVCVENMENGQNNNNI